MAIVKTAFIAGVGTEPAVKTSAAGKAWTSFSTCGGDKDDEQQWLRITVFGS